MSERRYIGIQPFKAHWLLYVAPGLTFTNSTFCPHSVFMCFVWISEQTAIISLYSINWLVSITKRQCVYCAVPAGSLNIRSAQHSVFMCFVWISEQTEIISLYSINWLVIITETECVYCAVRTGSLNIILRSAHTVYLCVLCGSQNKQRLFPYTALTDWFL
jgi:ribosomal protein S26